MKKMDLNNSIIREDMERIYESRADWSALCGKNVYITGATGMIASYLTAFFIFLHEEKNVGVSISAKVRNRAKLLAQLGEYARKAYFQIYEGDASDPIREDIAPDYIIHAASLASPQYYGAYPVETMLPNIIGTNEVLKLAVKSKSKGVVFFSSGSTYGSVQGAEVIQEDTVGVLRYLELGNAYGESKRCGEALCHAYCCEYGVPAKCVRIHHTYGPNMDYENDRRVFADFVKHIVEGKDIVLKSDGTAKRAFCYITDTISGILTVLLDGAGGEVYNIANENAYFSVGELARQLAALYPERKLRVVTQQRETAENYCPSNVKRLTPVSCEKLRKLGWNPQIPIQEGFSRTIAYIEG